MSRFSRYFRFIHNPFVFASLLGLSVTAVVSQAHAASSIGCEGGGFSFILPGSIVSGVQIRRPRGQPYHLRACLPH